MFPDNEYQVFGSELLDADCPLPPPTSASIATTSNGLSNCIANGKQTGQDEIKRFVVALKGTSRADLIVCWRACCSR